MRKSILPRIGSYGRYSSDNYGAHTLKVTSKGVTVYFSYDTPVAFSSIDSGRVVHQNIWGPTTGKHLNWIDGGRKESRVDSKTFERLWKKHVPFTTE